MPSISNRELRDLNIMIEPSETISWPEEFVLNPFIANMNLCSSEGSKLNLKSAEALPEDQKLDLSLENEAKAQQHLERCRSKFS